jgi:glycosyltransferase involved in cell wall biosynthesis
LTGAALRSACQDPLIFTLLQFEAVRERAAEFDVMHFHTDYLHFPMLRELKLDNALTTMHGRLDLPGIRKCSRVIRRPSRVDLQRSTASAARRELGRNRAAWPACGRVRLPGTATEEYLAFLGRISPEKRVDRAIEIARRAA